MKKKPETRQADIAHDRSKEPLVSPIISSYLGDRKPPKGLLPMEKAVDLMVARGYILRSSNTSAPSIIPSRFTHHYSRPDNDQIAYSVEGRFIPDSPLHNDQYYIAQTEYDKLVREVPKITKPTPNQDMNAKANGTAGNGNGYCLAPAIRPQRTPIRTMQPVDLVFDADFINKFSASRTGKHSWLDYIRVASTLPNIALVSTSLILDFETCGQIPTFTERNSVPSINLFHPAIARIPNNNYLRAFASEATRIITDDGGEILRKLPGKNPKIKVWHSPHQDDFYARCISARRAALAGDKGEADFTELVKMGKDAGEETIVDYCRSSLCERPVIILTDDVAFTKDVLGITQRDPLKTRLGHSVGIASITEFLHAMHGAFGADLGEMLAKNHGVGEEFTNPYHIMEQIKTHAKRIDKERGRESFFEFNDIMVDGSRVGKSQNGKPGPRLDDVLWTGRQMQMQGDRGDTHWVNSTRRDTSPDTGAFTKL